MERGSDDYESLSILNTIRICEKYKCLPSQLDNEDSEMVAYMEKVAILDNDFQKLSKKKNGQ